MIYDYSERVLPLPWRRRSGLLLLALMVLFSLLAARVVQLTVVEGDAHRLRAERNTVIEESIPAPRGRILDRKGRLLVTNHPVFDLYVVPAEMESPDHSLRDLAQIAQEDPTVLRKKLELAFQQAPLDDFVVERSLNDQALIRANRLAERAEGIYLGIRGERRYRYGKVASHIIGYMGALSTDELRTLRHEGYNGRDFVGKTGLEAQYDRELRGERGVLHRWVDANGRTLKTELVKRSVPGNDIYLNIDMQLQVVAEKALSESLQALAVKNGRQSGAAAVVFGADSGEILAMASLPNFDPAPFARGIGQKEYTALLSDKTTPLVNRASHASFSPGSTYKTITGMAALEMGWAQRGSIFHCGGSYKGAGCFVTSGHGSISFTDGLSHSCGVVFYLLGDRLGIHNLGKFSRAAGLGSQTGIDLPGEDPGLYPDPSWKKRVWKEEWYGGDTINTAVGQGFVLATPLQMARAVAALSNGGDLYRPRLVDRMATWGGSHSYQHSKDKMGKLPVDPTHLETVKLGMRGAVTHGTSTVADSPLAKVSGKTGTVESFANPFNPLGKNHTWFVCFAPFEKPEIAVAVFFEGSGGYGGTVSGPVARAIIDEYFGSRKK